MRDVAHSRKLAYGALDRRSPFTLASSADCRSHAADVDILDFAPHLLFSESVLREPCNFTSLGILCVDTRRFLDNLAHPSGYCSSRVALCGSHFSAYIWFFLSLILCWLASVMGSTYPACHTEDGSFFGVLLSIVLACLSQYFPAGAILCKPKYLLGFNWIPSSSRRTLCKN